MELKNVNERCIECNTLDPARGECDLCGLWVCPNCWCWHMTREEQLLYNLILLDMSMEEQGNDNTEEPVGRFN